MPLNKIHIVFAVICTTYSIAATAPAELVQGISQAALTSYGAQQLISHIKLGIYQEHITKEEALAHAEQTLQNYITLVASCAHNRKILQTTYSDPNAALIAYVVYPCTNEEKWLKRARKVKQIIIDSDQKFWKQNH